MSNNFLGEIRPFGGNFAPRTWAFCNGQLLSIAQNNALFALLGTTYGGDGTTTFALPNLQGRLSVHQGQGPGLTNRTLGEVSGSETVTLTINQIPQHNHSLSASTQNASALRPKADNLPGVVTVTDGNFYTDPLGQPTTPHTLQANSCTPSGGSQPHDNIMPFLCVSYIIALEGIFPSQN